MTTLPRDDYFLWPTNWPLEDCGSDDSRHLRAPENVGTKDPAGIRSLVAGLNPGPKELTERRFFVGDAGRNLRNLFEPLWAKAVSGETLVTNLVKIGTPFQGDLPRLESAACVRGCFLTEVRALPNLEQVFLLGLVAQGLFRDHVEPKLRSGLMIYSLRHPSRSHRLGTRLQEILRAQLATPRRLP
jgi:uracil-DNA glycosylase